MPLAFVVALIVGVAQLATAATFTVTSNLDAGPGTLRQAILDANADTAPDTIAFAIGSGAVTITPDTALPDVTNPVTIDGTTQPGYTGDPLVEIDGENVGPGLSGLALVGHTGSTIRGLVINRFSDTSQVGGNGILISGGGSHTIAGNWLGTDLTGTLNRGNGRYGVAIVGGSGNTIGGTTTAERNVISANASAGVLVNNTTSNVVQGNWIGLTAAGDVSLGNGNGVFLLSSSGGPTTQNLIGGDVPAAANVIAANGQGVLIGNAGASNNTVQGNLIGTDATGTQPRPNSQRGVIVNGAPANTIDGNVIVGSDEGIYILNDGADGDVIVNNKIGTDTSETLAMGNVVGIRIGFSASGSPNGATIGGAGAGNLITNSTGAGVAVVGGLSGNIATVTYPVGVEIRENRIFANGGLGIDLGGDGVTANDPLDVDDGENGLVNFPVVTGVVDMGDSVEFLGTLDAAASTTYRIELFSNTTADPSGNGEGQGPLGTTMMMTDPSGHGTFDVTLAVAVSAGEFVTATATDPAMNTSEFSPVFLVEPPTTTTTSTTTTLDTTTSTTTTLDTTTTTAEPTTTSTSMLESTTSTVEPTTSSTSTTLEPTTTTSSTAEPTTTTSSTVEPTTTTSSTAEPTTTTTSSTLGSTTSTSLESTTTTSAASTTVPTSSTTTITTAPTTTTTLPCTMSQPLAGLACRLNALNARVAQESALSAVVTKLQKQLEQAGTRVEDARETCLIGKTSGAKRKLAKASKALVAFEKILRSKKAKTAPQALRDEITGMAEAIGSDVGLVRIGLSCP